jgi:hypothetical protein
MSPHALLIKQLQKLPPKWGGYNEIDVDIHIARPGRYPKRRSTVPYKYVTTYDDGRTGVSRPPDYTWRTHDAMDLIDLDAGWLPHIECERRRGKLIWEVMLAHEAYDAIGPVFHESLPIAICIAALQAIEGTSQPQGDQR